MKTLLREEGPSLSVLGLILLVGLVLRVVHNDHGLPYVYYVDEGSHFTKRAIETFRDANPGYFQNPSGYTYLSYLVYRAIAVGMGGSADVVAAYRANATWVFEVSRALAAVLCLAGVAGVYAVGRSLWDRRTGLVAAAVLCFAFLPVAFSRLALTDVGALLPVALCLLCSVRLAETGQPTWCAGQAPPSAPRSASSTPPGLVVLVPLTGLALAAAARRAPPAAAAGGRGRRRSGPPSPRSSSRRRTSSWTSGRRCTSSAARPTWPGARRSSARPVTAARCTTWGA